MIAKDTNALLGAPTLPLTRYPAFNYAGLPAGADSTAQLAPYYLDWLAHPDYDSYWKQWSIEEHFADIQVPALHIGGWYDIFLTGTLRNELTILRADVTAFRPHQIVGMLRRLVAGAAYHLRSRDTDSLTGSRVFYSRRLLAAELGRVGLEIVREVPHGNPRSISVVARPIGRQGRDR